MYLMDCIEGMKLLNDESIDCIITDPPYGDNIGYGRLGKVIVNNDNPLLNCQMLFEAQRVLKNDKTVYNFTNWKHYPFLTEFILRYTCFNIRMMIVLNKNRFGLGYGFRNKHELILVLEKGEPKYNLTDFPTVLPFDVPEQDEFTHPHKKPEDIMRLLVKHSTVEGDLVLDCFVGSGSSMVACKQLCRHFIGFEIDKGYYDVACERLKQSGLFGLKSFEWRFDENEQSEKSVDGNIG